MKQTKIVASVSDLRCDVEFIKALYEAGINIVRLNTAHADQEGMRRLIENTRAVSNHLGILLDTKGPEIRTTGCETPVEYKAGDGVRIEGNPSHISSKGEVYVTYPNFAHDLSVGCHVLFDDGALDMVVNKIEGNTIFAEVCNDGVLGSKKSVNVPGVHIELPALTEKDIRNIEFAASMDVDFIAHSFVRSAADVKAVQEVIDRTGKSMQIISKIENQEGVDNIDEIIAASYGIMIARGDLGIEVPIEQIPGIQNEIIRKCRRARKPVIVATQMLHSMISNPRPTRAEVTDIANAIFSRTDAIMLSGETASGKYPVEAVKTMANIASQAEKDRESTPGFCLGNGADHAEREFFAQAAIRAAEQLNIKAIIIDSGTGQMARNLAAYRCATPIVAICYKEQLVRTLNLSYGVHATFAQEGKTKKELFHDAVAQLVEAGRLEPKDSVAYLTGSYIDGNLRTTLELSTVQESLIS